VKNLKFLLPIVALTLLLGTACDNDDDSSQDNFIPARDRAEENIDSTLEVDNETLQSVLVNDSGVICLLVIFRL
jgi:hypothetical protein